MYTTQKNVKDMCQHQDLNTKIQITAPKKKIKNFKISLTRLHGVCAGTKGLHLIVI